MNWRRMLDDLLFPPRCAVCDSVLELGKGRICRECQTKIQYVKEPSCLKCGKELYDFDAVYCGDCEKRKRSFQKGFPVFHYVPPVSDAIAMMKYHNREEYALFYGEEIVKKYGTVFRRLKIDAVVPVPIHRKKLLQRGYNQAELLAKVVGEKLEVPVVTDLIGRVENTVAQKKLSDMERERNLMTAFAAVKKKVSYVPECVLLVDDIYTTGATIEACTRTLLSIGVKKVYYTSACIGNPEA